MGTKKLDYETKVADILNLINSGNFNWEEIKGLTEQFTTNTLFRMWEEITYFTYDIADGYADQVFKLKDLKNRIWIVEQFAKAFETEPNGGSWAIRWKETYKRIRYELEVLKEKVLREEDIGEFQDLINFIS